MYKVGFTSVVGDLFHAGHIQMIQECKSQCEYLIVGLICDPSDRPFKNIPIESVYERYIRVSNCKGVDKVIPLQNEADLELFLKMCTDVEVRFVGADYKDKDFTGKKTCEEKGIKIIYNSRKHNLSSTNLRERIKNENKIRNTKLQ